MKGRGSITVFLSLILVLLFSFILTTLEAARITGATAYTAMLSGLSGESVLASYYYPLFKEYRLFGVDAGYETAYLSLDKLEEQLEGYVTYGTEGMVGGMFTFQSPQVEVLEYETLLSSDGQVFLNQIKEQLVYDGLSLSLSEIFQKESFTDAAAAGTIYKKQEEALTKTTAVTEEILKLMELVDGICTDDKGLVLDKEGRLRTQTPFIKQLTEKSRSELETAFDNDEVFQAVRGGLVHPKTQAERVRLLSEEGMELQADIAVFDAVLKEYKIKIKELEEAEAVTEDLEAKQLLIEQKKVLEEEKEAVSGERDMLVEQLDLVLLEAEEAYLVLESSLKEVVPLLKEALEILEVLEYKQAGAFAGVESYEVFLKEWKDSVSSELYEIFEKELERMKLYLGMEEQGYYVPVMRRSLEDNLDLLESLSFSGFTGEELARIQEEMLAVENNITSYSTEGLWFTYGDIVTIPDMKRNISGALEDLLKGGILSLTGISEADISGRKLSGQELLSASREKETFAKALLECMASLSELFTGEGFQEIFTKAEENTAATMALELYSRKYFSCYGEKSPYTKLNYEREYLIFGQKSDKDNLFYTVLWLVAVRTLFSMTELIKQPQRMAELQSLATGVAGFTGIPLLISAAKYALLLLWSVEEAFVEVAALLQGKKVAVLSGAERVLIEELFVFGKELVIKKAEGMAEEAGAGYQDYLLVFSLLQNPKDKLYYAMDLIQENIRYRYRDSFRLRNVVTSVTFQTKLNLSKKYETGLFQEEAYKVNWKERCAY